MILKGSQQALLRSLQDRIIDSFNVPEVFAGLDLRLMAVIPSE